MGQTNEAHFLRNKKVYVKTNPVWAKKVKMASLRKKLARMEESKA